MSRNVTILVIILVIILIAGWLVWVRGRFQAPAPAATITPTPEITISPEASASPTVANPSRTPSASVSGPAGRVSTSSSSVNR